MFLTIVLPGVFVMARHECCREIETAIFAARTNLPVLDFQTWQVWRSALVGKVKRTTAISFHRQNMCSVCANTLEYWSKYTNILNPTVREDRSVVCLQLNAFNQSFLQFPFFG